MRCQLKDEVKSNDEDEKKNTVKCSNGDVIVPDKRVNRKIALASVSGAVGLFVATRGWIGSGISLGDLSATVVPYDEALLQGTAGAFLDPREEAGAQLGNVLEMF